MDEALEAAAMRETREKTGYECHLLKHKDPTQRAHSRHSLQYTTPIAIQQQLRLGIRKLIFWYVAQVDSSSVCISDTQKGSEDFAVCWVGMNLASGLMAFEEEKKIVARAVEAVFA